VGPFGIHSHTRVPVFTRTGEHSEADTSRATLLKHLEQHVQVIRTGGTVGGGLFRCKVDTVAVISEESHCRVIAHTPPRPGNPNGRLLKIANRDGTHLGCVPA
jgi:hypothetical protein